MNANPPERGRIRVTTGDVALPVEVRDRLMRLVKRDVGEPEFALDPGIYMVSAHLPGGRQLAETVDVHAGTIHPVDLTPEPEALSPRARYSTVFAEAAAAPSFDQAVFPFDWSFRFLRMESLSEAVPDTHVVVEQTERRQGSLAMTIRVPLTAVVFVQIARAGEVPLNVALPATRGNGERCILTVEDRAGLLYVSALPAAGRVGRAAQYLAAGENQHAALLITGQEAEELLYSKITDPVGAAMGGYVLLRLGALERTHNWMDNLAAWFQWLPDGAIIAGEKAAMLGNHVQAAGYFLQAGKRGLPLFTDGFSVLVSRLRQYQTNAHIQARFTQDEFADVRALSARLEEWSPFVDFSALTLTFRAAELTRPAESQHRVGLGDFTSWVDRDGRLQSRERSAEAAGGTPRRRTRARTKRTFRNLMGCLIKWRQAARLVTPN